MKSKTLFSFKCFVIECALINVMKLLVHIQIRCVHSSLDSENGFLNVGGKRGDGVGERNMELIKPLGFTQANSEFCPAFLF